MRVTTILGTRPEAIKLAPVIKEFERRGVRPYIINTGQQGKLTDDVLQLFGIRPNINLFAEQGQTHHQDHLLGYLIECLGSNFRTKMPDWVIVQGDTTTALAGALAAFHNKVKIAHVEAGLRTWDMTQPFPEEMNRVVIDEIADYLFFPTREASLNTSDFIAAPGVEAPGYQHGKVVGNTVVDALNMVLEMPWDKPLPRRPYILVEAHRRENFGQGLNEIAAAVQILAGRHTHLDFIVSIHPNPHVWSVWKNTLRHKNMFYIQPPVYQDWVHLMKNARWMMTDSGGMVEEATALDKSVSILREKTERPEAVESRHAFIAGTTRYSIVEEVESFHQMVLGRTRISPYGDGHAAERIVECLLNA